MICFVTEPLDDVAHSVECAKILLDLFMSFMVLS